MYKYKGCCKNYDKSNSNFPTLKKKTKSSYVIPLLKILQEFRTDSEKRQLP